MTYPFSTIAGTATTRDRRYLDRDEVHFRARALDATARTHPITVVNISPHGLMARCDHDFAQGDRLRVMLPATGTLPGEVRWALGGRLGLQFDAAIDLASYYELLARMLKVG